MTWTPKETIRGIYDIDNYDMACEFVDQLAADLKDTPMPEEVRTLGRTLTRWMLVTARESTTGVFDVCRLGGGRRECRSARGASVMTSSAGPTTRWLSD